MLPDEWPWLREATRNGPVGQGQTGHERFLLYASAIRTGLRAKELRQLTRGRMFLDVETPYTACKAGTTKNGKTAKQYLETQLAGDLRDYLTNRSNGSRVFPMPHRSNTARILRTDLAVARAAWLEDTEEDADELERREASDFLLPTNHEGECFDFHSLRHTCGAWLALAGEHPKVVQTIMRHSQINLTMDTYGHLFPGQAAEAVARFGHMLAGEKQPPTGVCQGSSNVGERISAPLTL
jgi:integrase